MPHDVADAPRPSAGASKTKRVPSVGPPLRSWWMGSAGYFDRSEVNARLIKSPLNDERASQDERRCPATARSSFVT